MTEAAFEELQAAGSPWSGTGDRSILWRYLGGPRDEVELYDLSGEPSITSLIETSSRSEG